MNAGAQPVDTAERERIERSGLHETLFVDAGAGTGKTHELVERIVNLVLDGVSLSAIAAITFTEAAATELRDRIRESFERRLADRAQTEEHARCEAALAGVDEAAITTLHGFALRILSEHPLEVGLPPRVEVLDEVASQLQFEARWTDFVDGLYSDPDCEDLVLRAWAVGITIATTNRGVASLKDVAAIFDDRWDRLDALAGEPLVPLAPLDFTRLEAAAGALRASARACKDDNDRLYQAITGTVLPRVDAVLAADDPLRRLRLAKDLPAWKLGNKGAQKNWPDGCKDDALDAVANVVDVAGSLCQKAIDDALRQFAIRLARFTRERAEERRAEGRLDFHDLLVLARRLVRHSAAARAALHARYQRLLLDEFQDTDPIQIEIAVLIAAAVLDGEVTQPWTNITTERATLFFVGDPKQSIYRFRRADIGLYLAARRAFAGPDAVTLRQNFRTVGPILEWVNELFTALMPDEVEGAQARYQPLYAFRPTGPGDHRVTLLGGARDGNAGELREHEATTVAAAIASIRAEPDAWPVFDSHTGAWRHPRMADITILVPTRTSLRQLEDALDARAIPYRVATGTLVYDTQEVYDALAALRAIDDPADAIALVSALRSPLYACSDADLFTYVSAGGRWDLRARPPAALDPAHPVVSALAHLHSLWECRWWHEPSALLDRLLRERSAFALGFGHRRPREVWRRLRFLVDQARAFQEAGGGGLRAFLDWAELQRNEGSRVHEPLLADTDDDAVSILTIHGSKGLEFPITIVSGVTTEMRGQRKGVEVHWDGDIPEIRMKKDVVTANFDRLADFESEMDVHERKRLLYVACTRARDHLLVSTFHKPDRDSFGAWLATHSAPFEDTLCRRLPLDDDIDDHASHTKASIAEPAVADPASDGALTDDRSAWLAARAALLDRQRVPRFISATAVARLDAADDTGADGGDEDGGDDDGGDDSDSAQARIPWRRGRAGTAVGRAVHATLQLCRGTDDDELDALAEQQAHVEAIPDLAGTVAALARSALDAPAVRAAHAATRFWRELYVAAPIGHRAIEGYIDLLYETDDGLVLVDYKTDAVRSAAEIDAKVDRYRLQVAAYALALEAATGLAVVDARLVFCATRGAIERAVPELAAAKADVQRLLDVAPGTR